MYKYLDKLLAEEKKRVRTEFNRISVMGFDELNVTATRCTTQEMFDRLLEDNFKLYLKSAKNAYKKGVQSAKDAGLKDDEEEITESWVLGLLAGYNLVTNYLYDKEAERKRLRLNEQILTAREFQDRQLFNDSLSRTANLWWTQTTQYGISAVDKATIKAYKDMGVKEVEWVTAADEKTCPTCGGRAGKKYPISKVPEKPHYGCRCYVIPAKE